MASLGWLLNLDFAGQGVGVVPAGPIAGSLLLMGVGRMWWLPVVWEFTTGATYNGELQMLEEYGPLGATFAAGGLMAYGFLRIRAWLEARRRARMPEPLPPVDAVRRPTIIGSLTGPKRRCPYCNHFRDPIYLFSNRHTACTDCISRVPGEKPGSKPDEKLESP